MRSGSAGLGGQGACGCAHHYRTRGMRCPTPCIPRARPPLSARRRSAWPAQALGATPASPAPRAATPPTTFAPSRWTPTQATPRSARSWRECMSGAAGPMLACACGRRVLGLPGWLAGPSPPAALPHTCGTPSPHAGAPTHPAHAPPWPTAAPAPWAPRCARRSQLRHRGSAPTALPTPSGGEPLYAAAPSPQRPGWCPAAGWHAAPARSRPTRSAHPLPWPQLPAGH